MKIVHVFHHYYPLVGGMEKVIQSLAEEQAKLGHDVTVITSSFTPNTILGNIHNGVNIHRIKSVRFRYPDLTLPLNLPKVLLKQADIVHVHGHYSLFSQGLLSQAHSLSVPTACYFMAVNTFHDHPNKLIRWMGPYYIEKKTTVALKNSKLILVKSKRDQEHLRTIYKINAKYLPDAVDSLLIDKPSYPSNFIENHHIRQKDLFLFIGRMHKLKGPMLLVQALKYLDNDTAIVFIGPDGGCAREISMEAQLLGVKDRVYQLGYVDETTKIEAIDSAIALVNPSIANHVEVFSAVISEAWAREKPVIASAVGEVALRVKHNINGILVPPSNPKMLAAAMKKLAKDKELAKKMGKEGKLSTYSWSTVSRESIQLYTSAIEKRPDEL